MSRSVSVLAVITPPTIPAKPLIKRNLFVRHGLSVVQGNGAEGNQQVSVERQNSGSL